jgi:hypothetical protein
MACETQDSAARRFSVRCPEIHGPACDIRVFVEYPTIAPGSFVWGREAIRDLRPGGRVENNEVIFDRATRASILRDRSGITTPRGQTAMRCACWDRQKWSTYFDTCLAKKEYT